MDKFKSYIKGHEDLMNIEHADEHVWLIVHRALIKNATIKSYEQGHSLRPLNKIIFRRWASVIAISALVICSLAFRVKDSETIGHIISFTIYKNNDAAMQKIDLIERQYNFTFKRVKNIQREIASYIAFRMHAHTEVLRLENALNQIPGVKSQAITPVTKRSSESVLSKIVHKISNRHIDLKQTTTEELSNEILMQLKDQGIENIQIRIDDARKQIEFIPAPDSPGSEVIKYTAPTNVNRDTSTQEISNIKQADGSQPKTVDQLNVFGWILHTWRTCDSSLNSYHKWIRINDSVYRSFVIRLEPSITVTPAYFLLSRKNVVILAFDKNSWSLQESSVAQFVFTRNEGQFPQKVKWELRQPGWWFARIRGSLKDETCLYTDDSKDRQLDQALNNYKKQNPDLFK